MEKPHLLILISYVCQYTTLLDKVQVNRMNFRKKYFSNELAEMINRELYKTKDLRD